MATQKTISEVVRGALLLHPQGLTVREIAKLTGYAQDLVIACLRRTYGCYIADFTRVSNTRQFSAIWCCVTVPANAIKPLSSQFPAEVIDDVKEAADIKMRKAKREAAKRERMMQKLANKKIREAAKKKPTPPEYKPQRTVWVSVPSWGQAA